MGNCFTRQKDKEIKIEPPSNTKILDEIQNRIYLNITGYAKVHINELFKKNDYCSIELFDEYLIITNNDTNLSIEIYYFKIVGWYNTPNSIFGFKTTDNIDYRFTITNETPRYISRVLSRLTLDLKDYVDNL
mgnify:FL=1